MTLSDNAADSSQRPTSRKILLLEDDHYFAEFLCEFLSARGYAVTLVSDGEAGTGEIAASDFDFIVCDMIMPKLRGDLFYQAVERIKPHLCPRFVFMTGKGCDPSTQEFARNVESPILKKPFHINDLFRVLEEVQTRNSKRSR